MLDSFLADNQRYFNIEEYIDQVKGEKAQPSRSYDEENIRGFQLLCDDVRKFFDDEWERGQNTDQLETQKKALMGSLKEVNYYKEKISEYLKNSNRMQEWYPKWYENLTDAIYQELWGYCGIAPWISNKKSSSAKIIGDRIYYLVNGHMVLQEQRISQERYDQLKKAILLNEPEKRADEPYFEIYTLSKIRIAIYTGSITKEGQSVMVFRKQIIDRRTFEQQAELGTIPKDIIPMLKAMVDVGYNVAFTGAVRTGKTTFLETWQSYENQELEGVMVETDDEVPLHLVMPKAPIMQLKVEDEGLKRIIKNLLRSDADYMIMAEARDGLAFNLAVEMANRGTRRCKTTVHITEVEDFCYDVAQKINMSVETDLTYTILKVAKSFNYLLHFIQSPGNRGVKKLKGIYEIRYDRETYRISIHKICEYDMIKNTWYYSNDIGKDKEQMGLEENAAAMQIFKNELRKLSEKYPNTGNTVIYPFYSEKGAQGAQRR